MGSTKADIARATRELLEAEGAAAVSMRRVAEAVGVTPMTVYRHYADRAALLDEVCETAFREVAGLWRDRPLPGDTFAGLHRAADLLLDFALDRPHLYRYLFIDPRPGARRYPADLADGRSPTLDILIGVLRAGMRDGVLVPSDPVETALTLAAQLHGLVALYQGGRIGLSADGFRALCHDSLRRIFDGIAR